jgi:uncharacterized iron-regulated protein
MPLLAAALVLGLQQPSDPYTLPIGPAGSVMSTPSKMVRTEDGRTVSSDDVAAAADGLPFVFLGESHTNPAHHQMQAAIIQALVRRGRDVVVGFEMFTRPKQDSLNPWTLGLYNQNEFIEKSEWKTQWGFDYGLYKPIFDTIKADHLAMIALNVPRAWVHSVGQGGYAALTPDEKSQLPQDLFLGNQQHKAIFTSMMGGHPMTGAVGDNIYEAQVLWDEGMADTAIKYMQNRHPGPKTVFVVVAGAGHLMYKQGINYRIKRRVGMEGVTVVMTDFLKPTKVSKGLGDFVFDAPLEDSGGNRP